MRVVITVINLQDGETAEHTIHNQSQEWSEDRARRWVEDHEFYPWEYQSHHSK